VILTDCRSRAVVVCSEVWATAAPVKLPTITIAKRNFVKLNIEETSKRNAPFGRYNQNGPVSFNLRSAIGANHAAASGITEKQIVVAYNLNDQVPDTRPSRSRIVVDASHRHRSAPNQRRPGRPPSTEPWIAISIIIAAALATFLAMFITSRPFDPGAASVAPQQTIPAGPVVSPSARASPTISPSPQTKPSVQQSPSISEGEVAPALDDASIQSRIDAAFAADATLGKLDVSTLVENGKVTIFGSVRTAELKQRAEKVIRSIKGVATVNNQLVVSEATP